MLNSAGETVHEEAVFVGAVEPVVPVILPPFGLTPADASFKFTKFVSYGAEAAVTVPPEADAIVPTTSVPPASESVGPVIVVEEVPAFATQQASKLIEEPLQVTSQ